MQLALLLAGLSLAAQPVTFTAPQTAARELTPHLETGSLLVSRGDCLAVKVFTDSPYTHVASVVVAEHGPLVYDTVHATGARCLTLGNYLARSGRGDLQILHPRRPFTPEEARRYRTHLDSQLGRPYSLAHYVTGGEPLTGRRPEGMHCSEYAVEALLAVDRVAVGNPGRVSPGSLADSLVEEQLYRRGLGFTLAEPAPPRGRTWCEQLWFDTRHCTTRSCAQLRRWFLCQ